MCIRDSRSSDVHPDSQSEVGAEAHLQRLHPTTVPPLSPAMANGVSQGPLPSREANQSRKGRENMPVAGTNHERGERISDTRHGGGVRQARRS
eukprot:9263894-Pyramimonas_sp.AAC.1